jgi:phosphate starvation-inducible protein PhoH
MVSHFDQNAEQYSEQLDVRGLLAEQFLSTYGNAVQATREAVRPFHFTASAKGLGIQVDGDAVAVTIACRIFQQLLDPDRQRVVDPSSLSATISEVIANALRHDFGLFLKGLSTTLSPKSLSQVAFLRTLLSSDEQLIIGLGLTGTGKTHLAIAAALNKLAEERFKHVLITRPHVVMEGDTVTATTRLELEPDSQLDYFDDILHDLVAHQEIERLKAQRKVGGDSPGTFAGQNLEQHVHYP